MVKQPKTALKTAHLLILVTITGVVKHQSVKPMRTVHKIVHPTPVIITGAVSLGMAKPMKIVLRTVHLPILVTIIGAVKRPLVKPMRTAHKIVRMREVENLNVIIMESVKKVKFKKPVQAIVHGDVIIMGCARLKMEKMKDLVQQIVKRMKVLMILVQ